jgi:hypothetical protein
MLYMIFLNLDLDYESHPKTQRLVGLLGNGSEMIPIRLWSYVGKCHPEDGLLTGYGIKEIESIVKWLGNSGEAVSALTKTGFLEKIDNGYHVHEWEDYQRHIYSFRIRNSKVAKNRWRRLKNKSQDIDSNDMQKSIPLSFSFISDKEQESNMMISQKQLDEIQIPEDLIESKKEILDWIEYKRQRGQRYKPGRGIAALFNRFREIPINKRKESVEWSMANNWAGLFEHNNFQNKQTSIQVQPKLLNLADMEIE